MKWSEFLNPSLKKKYFDCILLGKLTCHDITSVLRQGNLIELSEKSTGDDGLNFLLNNLYNVVDEIVHDKFVTCMHASTLGCSAWEIGDLYLEKLNQPDSSEDWSHLKEKSSMWKALAVRLQDLAKFQHKSIKIHHDFQKSNYAPDPRAKYAYGSTIFISVAGFLYMCLKNLTCMDPNEFIHLT